MRVVLISTYELGHQPFGLASPAAWLRAGGATVTCIDLSREALLEAPVREAGLVAFYVPMHTATRLAVQLVEPVRRLNPRAHLCFYGLYAPVNEAYLRGLGVETILGGEFEGPLAAVVARLQDATSGRGPSTNRFPGPSTARRFLRAACVPHEYISAYHALLVSAAPRPGPCDGKLAFCVPSKAESSAARL